MTTRLVCALAAGVCIFALLAGHVVNSAVAGRSLEGIRLQIEGYAVDLALSREQTSPAIASQVARADERVSILVHLAQGRSAQTGKASCRAFANECGGTLHHEYDILPGVVNLRNIPAIELERLRQLPGVVKVEEDPIIHASLNDSVPLVRALQSRISSGGFSATGSGIRICIVDTGIDSDSGLYSSRIDTAAGWDFVNGDANPEDDNGHGSHVAGIAAAGLFSVDFGCVGSEPFQGMAPGATLIGVKVLDSAGSGFGSDIIAGIDRCASAATPGGPAHVINMSLGGGAFSGPCDFDTIAQAANNAVSAGVVVVVAAGNEGNTNELSTPACASSAIAVGATYDDSYPNCEFPAQTSFTFCTATNVVGQCIHTCTDSAPAVDDLTCMSNQSDELDVAAPGCITFSADSQNSLNGIVGFCGTSMAAPHVAGLAALILDAAPSLTPAQVRQAIRDGAIDMGPAGFDRGYGFGRIDALNSLQLASPGCNTDGDCDNGVFCDGEETCDAMMDCQAGGQPCFSPCEQCDEAADRCNWCVFDLNQNGVTDGLDFGFFSGCFGACYPPSDPCAAANFDGDANGCVGTSDFAGFAGCFGLGCGDCANCFPMAADNMAATAAVDEPLAASVQLVPVRTSTESDFADTLPSSAANFHVRESFDLEIWASRGDVGSVVEDGLAAVFVDLDYDPSLLSVEEIIPSEAFELFSGATKQAGGRIAAVGGCATLGAGSFGIDTIWVRVATVSMRVIGSGKTILVTRPSGGAHGLAVIGHFGDLDGARIEFGRAALELGSQTAGPNNRTRRHDARAPRR